MCARERTLCGGCLVFALQETLRGRVDDLTVEKVGCYWMLAPPEAIM